MLRAAPSFVRASRRRAAHPVHALVDMLEARLSRGQTRALATVIRDRSSSVWVRASAPPAARSAWRAMSAEAAQSPPWAAPPPPELDAHGFATARSARYADSHEQALAQCVEDVMAQLEHKGCAGAENIVSVLWVSENKQVLRAGPAVRARACGAAVGES